MNKLALSIISIGLLTISLSARNHNGHGVNHGYGHGHNKHVRPHRGHNRGYRYGYYGIGLLTGAIISNALVNTTYNSIPNVYVEKRNIVYTDRYKTYEPEVEYVPEKVSIKHIPVIVTKLPKSTDEMFVDGVHYYHNNGTYYIRWKRVFKTAPNPFN